ncbi:DUF6281 family protein [Streptomyces globisporus]|nr:DUF6281 family protein [Streptomyces globisporus]
MTITDLPSGSDALGCGAVGRVVTHDGAGVTVPEPGIAVSVHAIRTDGKGHGFTLQVAADGSITYQLASDAVDTETTGSDQPDSVDNPTLEGADLTHEGDSVGADAPDKPASGESDVGTAVQPACDQHGADGEKRGPDKAAYEVKGVSADVAIAVGDDPDDVEIFVSYDGTELPPEVQRLEEASR